MAEVLQGLRKKLHRKKAMKNSGSKSSTQKSTSTNPYASRGLEKFAVLLEDIQVKQQATKSLVERTASSLSAARSISRSAQEWTASTLVRRCSPETTQVLNCAAPVAAPVEEVQGDLDNLREEQHPQGCQSNSAPSLGVRLPIRRCRSMTSRSAFVMLLTLSAFLCSRAGRVGKPFLAALTCSAMIQIWRRGRVSARFMFSSVALYLLTPLRSYLVTSIPKQLIVAPQNPESSQNAVNDVSEVRESPVAALPLSPISESRPTESPKPVTLRPSRRLAKKISSGLKKLRMFRSSSSSVSVHSISETSSVAPASPKSAASNHRRTCPFSRKMGVVAETQASDATSSSSRKGGILRRQRSSESVSCSSRVGLRGGRMLSSETIEQYNQAGEGDSIASSACESKRSTSSSSSSGSVDHEATAPVAWHLVGLLVTLLFLLVGRVPAIMATSLFFVVVSPHSRGRERRESRAHWEAAARKLNRSPPPRVGRRAVSPPPRWH